MQRTTISPNRKKKEDHIKSKRAEWNKNYAITHPKQIKVYHKKADKKYKDNHKEQIKKQTRLQKIRYHYGVTPEEYTKMFNKQNGKCAICGRHQSELTRSLCVDHNHKTGKIRGLLCNRCNLALSNINEDINLLKPIKNYLIYYNK